MLNERERRVLDDLERRILADDPGFAGRMSGRGKRRDRRALLRRVTSAPVILLLLAAAVGSFVVQVSSIGWLLLCCALASGGCWLARAAREGDPWLDGPPPAPRTGAASADGAPERD